MRAIVGRVHADDVAKGPAEGAETGEPDVEADVGDAAVGLAEQEHRALDPAALKITMRRLAVSRPERPYVVGLRDARHLSQRLDVQRLRIGPVDRVARAKHPAIELLDGPGHESKSLGRPTHPWRADSSPQFVVGWGEVDALVYLDHLRSTFMDQAVGGVAGVEPF